MKEKINSYFAILLITLAGSGATLLIVRIATTDATSVSFGGSEAKYVALKQSILKSQ